MLRKSTKRADLEMARIAFLKEGATRTRYLEAACCVLLAVFKLGNVRKADNLIVQAIEQRRKAGQLAVPFASLALRTTELELARAVIAQADRVFSNK